MPSSLVETLETLEAPWVGRTKRPPPDSLVLSVIALLGQRNEEWLRTFLALPHRLPSHDTPPTSGGRPPGTRTTCAGQSASSPNPFGCNRLGP